MLKVRCIDHFVITTTIPNEIISFYQKLGFTATIKFDESELVIGDFKINVQTLGKELLPHAKNVKPGSADICFHVDQTVAEINQGLKTVGISIEVGPVQRVGAKGNMTSVYLRDPDNNLIELSSYE